MEPDEALVRKARGGDRAAFGALVERHSKAVFGLLLSLLRNWSEAEEAAQAAFVKAYAKLGSFQGRSSFRTWVCSIAINEGRNRRRWSALRRYLPLAGAGEDSGDWERRVKAQASQDEVAAVERRLEVERAMLALAPREREMTVLRLEGYTLAEIADALGVTEGTVKSTLFEATRKMRERLHGTR